MSRRIIDIHNHPNWHGYTVDRLVANMDEHGIERTWLLSWEIPQREFDITPSYHDVMDPRGSGAPLWMVLEAVTRHPDRFVPGWAPDPRDRFVRARLKSAVDHYEIKVYGELKLRMRYDNPDAIAAYRYCAELGIPVLFHLECPPHRLEELSKDIHSWPPWYGGDVSVVENMCRLCPETIFIGHGPGFWREVSADADQDQESYPKGPISSPGRLIELMRRYKNLHADLSAGSGRNALTRDMDHAREFVLEFQDRILFGRDYFDGALLDTLEQLDLPADVLDKILCRNALHLMGDD